MRPLLHARLREQIEQFERSVIAQIDAVAGTPAASGGRVSCRRVEEQWRRRYRGSAREYDPFTVLPVPPSG